MVQQTTQMLRLLLMYREQQMGAKLDGTNPMGASVVDTVFWGICIFTICVCERERERESHKKARIFFNESQSIGKRENGKKVLAR